MSLSELTATIRYFWVTFPEHRALFPLLLFAYLLAFPVYWVANCRKFLNNPPKP